MVQFTPHTRSGITCCMALHAMHHQIAPWSLSPCHMYSVLQVHVRSVDRSPTSCCLPVCRSSHDPTPIHVPAPPSHDHRGAAGGAAADIPAVQHRPVLLLAAAEGLDVFLEPAEVLHVLGQQLLDRRLLGLLPLLEPGRVLGRQHQHRRLQPLAEALRAHGRPHVVQRGGHRQDEVGRHATRRSQQHGQHHLRARAALQPHRQPHERGLRHRLHHLRLVGPQHHGGVVRVLRAVPRVHHQLVHARRDVRGERLAGRLAGRRLERRRAQQHRPVQPRLALLLRVAAAGLERHAQQHVQRVGHGLRQHR
mmetsp:Transcript_12340/g.30218  ORF Transcript_12340/g.30218 Transcript_12340/m.30218 type:complete len:307 (+) Transcript_12340:89-1009(+)